MNLLIPTQTFAMPSDHADSTQIQQLKAAGKSGNPPSANPLIKTPTTQGLPKVVGGVAVAKKTLNTTTNQLTVSFTRDPGDQYFTTAKVYLRLGGAAPVLVSEGSKSPIVFSVAKSQSPATIVVVSAGNWGSTPVTQSPAKSVSLA